MARRCRAVDQDGEVLCIRAQKRNAKAAKRFFRKLLRRAFSSYAVPQESIAIRWSIQMVIPTEPIGSIPRPQALIDAIAGCGDGMDESLDPLYGEAIRG